MKHFANRPLPLTIVLSFLLLNILSPKLNAEVIFGSLQEKQPMLVYSFVWIPLMEISILVTEHLIPSSAIQSSKGETKNNTKKQANPFAEYLLNLSPREPMIIKRLTTNFLIFEYIPLNSLKSLINNPGRTYNEIYAFFTLTALILLFIKLMPRNDTSDLLPC